MMHEYEASHEYPGAFWVPGCPNWSGDPKRKVTQIILHCTTTANIWSSVAWFMNPKAEVSAHFLVSTQGVPYQMVGMDVNAFHTRHLNSSSVGIEISASPTDKMTKAQEKALTELLKFLCKKYGLSSKDVTAHRFALHKAGLPVTTTCPDALFPTEDILHAWVTKTLAS